MKHVFILCVLICVGAAVNAQQATPAEALAQRIATKMRDSLQLSSAQKDQVYAINLQLHNQKMQVWQQHGGADALLQQQLQRVENQRDSLYRPVLSDEQYRLYLHKKRALVNNK